MSIEEQDDLDRERLDESNRRPAAIIGFVSVVLICLLAVGVYLSLQPRSDRLIQREEEEFRAGMGRPAPTAPRTPPSEQAQAQRPAAPQDTRLAEYMLRLEQQRLAAEEAAKAKAREEAERQAREAAERRRQRVSAGILVQSSGGTIGPEPARVSDPADAFARALTAANHAGSAPTSGARAYGFLPSAGSAAAPTVRARMVGPLPYRLNQGKIISAVLESRIVSDKPGIVRAMVDEEVYSEDGTLTLVRPGARLIGEYRNGGSRGDARLLVVWNRLIRPDGATIDLTSLGVDELGVSGLTGDVDSRFLERFGAAILLSIVDVAAQNQTSDGGIVIADSAGSSASVALRDSINIPPRITIDQGQRIAIMVAKDLDFQPVGPAQVGGP